MCIVCKVLAKAVEISCSAKAILPGSETVGRKMALLKHSVEFGQSTEFHFSRMRSLPKFTHKNILPVQCRASSSLKKAKPKLVSKTELIYA